ncbi:hypothetical protein STEG23_035395 [Scotinomys teguina]
MFLNRGMDKENAALPVSFCRDFGYMVECINTVTTFKNIVAASSFQEQFDTLWLMTVHFLLLHRMLLTL